LDNLLITDPAHSRGTPRATLLRSITHHSANLWSGIVRTENWIIQTRKPLSCKRVLQFSASPRLAHSVLYISRLDSRRSLTRHQKAAPARCSYLRQPTRSRPGRRRSTVTGSIASCTPTVHGTGRPSACRARNRTALRARRRTRPFASPTRGGTIRRGGSSVRPENRVGW
jgi:hypothetical protein